MTIDATAIILAIIAAVPGTIVAVAAWRSSGRTKREVKAVSTVAHDNANKIATMHAESKQFMQKVAVTTAEFRAAQLKQAKRDSGFAELDP